MCMYAYIKKSVMVSDITHLSLMIPLLWRLNHNGEKKIKAAEMLKETLSLLAPPLGLTLTANFSGIS